MSAVIRNEFRVFNAKGFASAFSSGSNLYMGIARPYYWDLVGDTDVAPDLPANDIIGVDHDWSDMMQLKLVNPANISNGVFKEMWTPNTMYDTYRHDWNGTRASVYNGSNPYTATPADLSQAKYYVITPNYNIYICLQQKTIGGVVQPSTVNPDMGVAVGTNTGIVTTSDGYYWKYMGATSPSAVVSFMTDTYHPVKTITVAPGATDAYYPQWLNQTYSASFIKGIYTINVLSGGTGYNSGAAGTVAFPSAGITVTGDGNGIAGNVVFGVGGGVQQIIITNPGAGYTFFNMTITGGTGFTYDPIFTAPWGLGTDPVRDLNAYYAIVNNSLNSNEGGVFTVQSSYRKILLVANPTLYNSSTLATYATLDATTTLVLSGGGGPTGYTAGQVVTDSVTGAKGRVVDWNNTTGYLRIIRTYNENAGNAGASLAFQVGSIVSTGTGTISSIITPTVQPGSGSVVYAEYRTPITRSLGQSENITLVLEF